MKVATIFAVAVLMPYESGAVSVQVEPDRMVAVNGKRTFILGLYENPGDEAVLAQVVESGFNLVRAEARAEALDRLQGKGIRAWVNTGSSIDLSEDPEPRRKQLEELAARLQGHPALLCWEVPDEALWNCWYEAIVWRGNEEGRQQRLLVNALGDHALQEELNHARTQADHAYAVGDYKLSEELADEIWRKLGKEPPKPTLNISNAAQRAACVREGLLAGHTYLKSLDPDHPVWMNHAPRNQIPQLRAFNEAADIVGCDIYPVPPYRGGHSDISDRSLSAVGAYTARMQIAAPYKPVWMVLQGFGWADIDGSANEYDKREGRRPSYDELRFMAYDAIVRGARGILFWGTHAIEKDSELWQDLLKLVRELADLQPVLSAPDAILDPRVSVGETWGSVDKGVEVLPKRHGQDIWLLAVNEWHEPLEVVVENVHEMDGVQYVDKSSGTEVWANNGRLDLKMPGNGVYVLAPATALAHR